MKKKSYNIEVLYNALYALGVSVSIGKGDIGLLPHVVLEILPADARGKVFHDDSVGRPCGGAVTAGAETIY